MREKGMGVEGGAPQLHDKAMKNGCKSQPSQGKKYKDCVYYPII